MTPATVPPDLSVVIGFRNWGLPRLELALRAHAESTFRERLEVIVSDYGSDNRSDVERAAREHGARYVFTDVSGPWSRARALNAGVRASDARVIITTDADLLFTPGLHETAYARLHDDPRSVQLVQCRDLSSDFGVEGIDRLDWEAFEANSTFRPRWGMGGMIAFWRESLKETGGYDERMEMYAGEDLDFAQRLAWAGHRLSWIDDRSARIYHVWHPSSRTAANRVPAGREAIERNKSIYLHDKTIVRNVRRPPVGPLATVAIATYNRAGYLRQALHSVLSQPVEDIEVLIVDDGSADETADVVDEMRDPRLRYIRQANGGVAQARNRAVAEARSKYVIVHDDDDIFLPWRIEAHFDALSAGVHGSYGGWVDFGPDGDLTPRSGKEFSAAAVLYAGAVLLHPTLMVRQDILARFPYNEELRAGSDYNLVLRLATAGVTLRHTGEFHILRRLHESNLTQTLADHQQESARRTTNLLRRRLSQAEENEARSAARSLGPVECRGVDDVGRTVGAFLPDELVRRTLYVDDVRRPRVEEATRLLEAHGARCKPRYGVETDGSLSVAGVSATPVPWVALQRLRAAGLAFTVATETGSEQVQPSEAGAELNGVAAADAEEALRRVVSQVIEAAGPAGNSVAVAFAEVETPAARALWNAPLEFQRLVAVGEQQYVTVGSIHAERADAIGAVSRFDRFAPSVRSLVVDMTDESVRDSLVDPPGGAVTATTAADATSARGSSARKDSGSRRRIQDFKSVVERTLPTTAHVAVVSRGDDELLDLNGRRAHHFPEHGGKYVGHHPADSHEALSYLRDARSLGAEYLLFPPTSAWWLEYYETFRHELERRHRCVHRGGEGCIIFDIREAGRPLHRAARAMRDAIRRNGS